MLCENIFCIYWSNKECSLNEISLDIQGNCKNCIYVDIDENILEKLRKNLFKKYDDKYIKRGCRKIQSAKKPVK